VAHHPEDWRHSFHPQWRQRSSCREGLQHLHNPSRSVNYLSSRDDGWARQEGRFTSWLAVRHVPADISHNPITNDRPSHIQSSFLQRRWCGAFLWPNTPAAENHMWRMLCRKSPNSAFGIIALRLLFPIELATVQRARNRESVDRMNMCERAATWPTRAP